MVDIPGDTPADTDLVVGTPGDTVGTPVAVLAAVFARPWDIALRPLWGTVPRPLWVADGIGRPIAPAAAAACCR